MTMFIFNANAVAVWLIVIQVKLHIIIYGKYVELCFQYVHVNFNDICPFSAYADCCTFVHPIDIPFPHKYLQ